MMGSVSTLVMFSHTISLLERGKSFFASHHHKKISRFVAQHDPNVASFAAVLVQSQELFRPI